MFSAFEMSRVSLAVGLQQGLPSEKQKDCAAPIEPVLCCLLEACEKRKRAVV